MKEGREKDVPFTEHPVDWRHREKWADSIFAGECAEAEAPLDIQWGRGLDHQGRKHALGLLSTEL